VHDSERVRARVTRLYVIRAVDVPMNRPTARAAFFAASTLGVRRNSLSSLIRQDSCELKSIHASQKRNERVELERRTVFTHVTCGGRHMFTHNYRNKI
jgi:hypothetical protein